MADKSTVTIPETQCDFILFSGDEINLSLEPFLPKQDKKQLKFHTENLPNGIIFDANELSLRGVAPKVDHLKEEIIRLHIHDQTQNSQTILNIHLTIFSDAERIFETEQVGENLMKLASQIDDVALKNWINYLIERHFSFVCLFDGDKKIQQRGKLLTTKEAKSGWLISQYENCIIVNPGKMTFAEGNLTRMCETLEEVLENDVVTMGWQNLGIESNSEKHKERAWLIAHKFNKKIKGVTVTQQMQAKLNRYTNLSNAKITIRPTQKL